jgi:predicted CopG family antitoxin
MKTITISDALYERLTQSAQEHGLSDIDQLFERWEVEFRSKQQRESVVDRINTLRETMTTKYGVMPDSVELVREDREREG